MLYFDNLKAFNMDIFPTYPGKFTIDWLSIVLIAIVVIFAIEGLIKGTAKTFLNKFGGIIVFVLSFIAGVALCNVLADMDFADSIKSPISNFFLGMDEDVMGQPHSRYDVFLVLTNNGYSILTSKFVPTFLCPVVVAFFCSCVPEVAGEKTVAECFGSGVTTLIFGILIFVIVCIILSIILGAIKKAVHKAQKVKKPGVLSRIFGLLLGSVMGVIMMLVTVWIIKLLGSIDFFKNFLNEVWALQDDDVLTLGEYLYKTDYISMFFGWLASLFM